MIDIELACGWRVVGTTARPRGLQVHDADGNLVEGVKEVTIRVSPSDWPSITVEMMPKLDSGRERPVLEAA